MVIATAKTLTTKILPLRRQSELSAKDVQPALDYIEKYWPKLTRFHPKDDDTLLGLPHPYLVSAYEPGHEFDFNELYYWDSYFMVQGMLDKQNKELAIGILDNLLSLYERFKIIPNASRTYLMGRSQPPFLTSFILDVYHAYNLDKKWLGKRMKVAQEEYANVWMGTHKPNIRLVHKGLSRYYDINSLHDLAEAESGWDMTTRFSHRCLNYLPVDLNALLYKYEKDFSWAAGILGNEAEAKKWDKAARTRKRTMDSLMWSELKGLYYDYNYTREHRGGINSLAAYYPLWAGMADEHQAEKLVSSLRKFENQGGLATTDAIPLGQMVPGAMPTQWAYPNGWAPLHFIVVKGLQRYGYQDEARRIALKWIKTNLDWFNKHGVFLEKYNVVQRSKPPAKGVYPSQTGFGWTNAVFTSFCREFVLEN